MNLTSKTPKESVIKKDCETNPNMNTIVNSVVTMREKMENCSPYNLFFTKVPRAELTMNGYNCISFSDLICPSIGELEESLQLNYIIDVKWLIDQYQIHNLHTTPITIIYGDTCPLIDEEPIENVFPNVKVYPITMKNLIGLHHSKIGIYKYKNGSIRIVVSTANLYYQDWNHYNQAVWVSPLLPKMDMSKKYSEWSGPTNFKLRFLSYLRSYNLCELNSWINLVKAADFSAVKVYFVSSIPGWYTQNIFGSHMHDVGYLLSRHCSLPSQSSTENDSMWSIIAQSSAIGVFGRDANDWINPVLLHALSRHRQNTAEATPEVPLSIIYPSMANVENSLFKIEEGTCLPYEKHVHDKQKWLNKYLHQWKADKLGRTGAMPHIKSYVRISPCLEKLAWCLISSANISKGAWGTVPKSNGRTYIRSYEAGVLFMPNAFDEEYFYIKRESTDKGNVFPLMYDLPLEPYKPDDDAFCSEVT